MTLADEVREARLAEAADGIRRSQGLLGQQQEEFKALVRKAHEAGMTIREIAAHTKFAPSWIGTIVRKS